MAAPHTTGVAALVKQAHPDWGKVKYWEAAISNTADPGMVAGYNTLGAGTGFIQAVPATQTQVVALGSMGRGGDDDNHENGRHGGNAQTATLELRVQRARPGLQPERNGSAEELLELAAGLHGLGRARPGQPAHDVDRRPDRGRAAARRA